MRKLVYYVAVTLDGFIAGRDGDFSMFDAEGEHMEAILRDYRDTLPGPALTAMGLHADRSGFSTVLMGWNTYAVGLPLGLTDPYPHLDTVVFSRSHTGDDDTDPAVRVTDDDPVAVVRELKRRDGCDIWLCGGGQLATALQSEIDTLVLKINPLALGDGIPLFAPPPLADGYPPTAWPARFSPTVSTSYASGVMISEFARVP
ncbi:dihydrofolate reductase family protein [Herbiconiux sp. UC225_62]|uniref:dihydrofolate reductase family protein n=1 Tax=Herbiconiux sp. UC225_62 TaxID=3350168 RepID=UPI0036D2882E